MTLPLSLAELLAAEERVKYLYFWGHQPQHDGSIGQSCLSQWWPSRFAADGETFGSAEHYMMWRKARLFGDDVSAAKILAVKHPAEAKKLGRGVAGFSEDVWVRERFGIVTDASEAKFGADPALRDYLLGTRNRVLVEASPLDRVWGIGLAADDPRAQDPSRWRGLNLLGFALMAARERLA